MMTYIPKAGLQRLDFLPVRGVSLFRPACGCLHILLEAGAGSPFTLDLERRPLLSRSSSLFCLVGAGPKLF
jgi:hypothetical protein